MREQALLENHDWVVREAREDSQDGRPGRPPQAKGLPHFGNTVLLTSLALLASLVFLGTLQAAPVRYPSPIELALSPDGAHLFVLCEGTDELFLAAAPSGTKTGGGPRGGGPAGSR